MPDNEVDFAAQVAAADQLEKPDRVLEDESDAHAEDIPQELIDLSVALDAGDAENTALHAADFADKFGGEA